MSVDVDRKVREFLADNFPRVGQAASIPEEQSLVQGGVIDSLGVVALVTFLEEEFSIVIGDDEVVPEHLDSVAAIRAFVVRKAG